MTKTSLSRLWPIWAGAGSSTSGSASRIGRLFSSLMMRLLNESFIHVNKRGVHIRYRSVSSESSTINMLTFSAVSWTCAVALPWALQARNLPLLQPRQFPDPQQKYYNGTGQNTSDPVSLRITTQGGGRNSTGELPESCYEFYSRLINKAPLLYGWVFEDINVSHCAAI